MGTKGDQPKSGLGWLWDVLNPFRTHDKKPTQEEESTNIDSGTAPEALPATVLNPDTQDEPAQMVAADSVTEPTVGAETAPEVTETDPAEPVPAQVPKPVKAIWETRPAKDSWYPSQFNPRLSTLEFHQYQDNYGVERRAANGWHIVGATRRGKKHAHDGTHREDAFASETADKFTILCVADGAGSSTHSRIGAQYAANELVHDLSVQLMESASRHSQKEHVQFVEYLKQQFEKSIHHVIHSLVNYAEKNGVSPKDFRCTLLTALFYHDEKHQVVLLNQIGDGAICTYDKKTGETEKLGGEGESGSHSGEVSRFVPDEESLKTEFHVLPDNRMKEVDCLMLCTDGIEDPFYPMEKNSACIFRQLYNGVQEKELADLGIEQVAQAHVFGHPAESANLESWMTFEQKGESDDRTMLVMFRGEG